MELLLLGLTLTLVMGDVVSNGEFPHKPKCFHITCRKKTIMLWICLNEIQPRVQQRPPFHQRSAVVSAEILDFRYYFYWPLSFVQ